MNKNQVLMGVVLLMLVVGGIFYLSFFVKPVFAQYGKLSQMASPAAISLEKLLGVQSKLFDMELEGPVEILGRVLVVHGDPVDGGKSDNFYFIRDSKTDRIYELRSDKELPSDLVSGAVVKVKGNAKSKVINIDGTQGGGGLTIVEEATIQSALVNRRVLVIPANFSDRNLSCSSTQLSSIYFNETQTSVATTYPEVTNGAVGFYGDTLAPTSLSYSYTSTDYQAWASELNQYAISLGYNLADYDHVSYVVPANATNYGGLGEVNAGRTWIFYCSPSIVQHELGHNLGLAHASTAGSEYGDRSDSMGNPSGSYHDFNAPHKDQLNWVPDASIINVSDQNAGSFTLSPVDYPVERAIHPYMLRISNPGSTLQGSYYYISYRVAEGVTSDLITEYKDTISIHSYRGYGYANTYLVKTLNPGESFTDVGLGLNVSFSSKTTDSAVVNVDFVCVAQKPIVSITPTSYTVNNIESKIYAVTVQNIQRSSCVPETYNLSLTAPDGWTHDNTFLSQTIDSGQSVTKDVIITPPSLIAEGKYNLGINVINQNGVSTPTSVIYELDMTPPSIPMSLQGTYRQKKVNLNWLTSTDTVGVSYYNIYRNNTLLNKSTVVSYSDLLPSAGVNVYYVTAIDRAGNESSPSNSVSIDTGPSGGSKGKPTR